MSRPIYVTLSAKVIFQAEARDDITNEEALAAFKEAIEGTLRDEIDPSVEEGLATDVIVSVIGTVRTVGEL